MADAPDSSGGNPPPTFYKFIGMSLAITSEKLSFHGKLGCALCIVGSVVIVLNAPAQAAVTDIDEFKHFVIQPGFLVYMCLVIIGSLGIIWKVAPKYGKKHLLVYVSVCSLIGSLSVVATQGLGAAIVHNITTGAPQFNQWFIYVTIVFVICTLLTEINYLNKALNLFNTAMVTPVYYVFFTSATLVASVILFQGFSASASSIVTVVMGFFVICIGVVLLQTSKINPEVMKKSKSSLVLHENDEDDDLERILPEDKDELEPGPIGLRAVPFDTIRQIVRASTMPITSSNRASPTFAAIHEVRNRNNDSNNDNRLSYQSEESARSTLKDTAYESDRTSPEKRQQLVAMVPITKSGDKEELIDDEDDLDQRMINAPSNAD
ncbi:hypothetical protein BGX20_007643 [Mortierella sp. AD010]|nr:hypothetical protein BGX20_007643 [Mortierella sp. AD010]